MIVKFIDPVKKGLYNPLKPGDFSKIPKCPGIYIYGVKIKLYGHPKEVFIPLYVGIMNDLQYRLNYHYNNLNNRGNGKKEIFDLSLMKNLQDVNSLYIDMKEYDKYKGIHKNRINIPLLIWLNGSKYFDERLCLTVGTSKYKKDSGVQNSIKTGGDLDTISTKNALILKNKIIETKNIYTSSFHFVYVELEDVCNNILDIDELFKEANDYRLNKKYTTNKKNASGKHIAEKVELATKKALQKIGIYTTAKANGGTICMEIDLSEIKADLVNIGGHSYGTPYKTPLLIAVP